MKTSPLNGVQSEIPLDVNDCVLTVAEVFCYQEQSG